MVRLMQPQPQPPELHPPLDRAWHTDPGVGYLDLTPVANEAVVVVAGARLAGLNLADGKLCWSYAQTGSMLDLTASVAGPIIAHATQNHSLITALTWQGDVRWQIDPGIAMAGRSLTGLDGYILARGVHLRPSVRQVCRLINAVTGTVEAEYPHVGGKPDIVPRGILASNDAGSPDETGLWLYDFTTQHAVRLHDAPHEVRIVEDALVIIDASDRDQIPPQGDLLAFDTTRGALLWSAPGGPNHALAADRYHVASVIAPRENQLLATLRDLRSGALHWTSEPILGQEALPVLAADAVLLFVDGKRLVVLDRINGNLLQNMDQPSTLIFGGCLAGNGLINVFRNTVSCLKTRS